MGDDALAIGTAERARVLHSTGPDDPEIVRIGWLAAPADVISGLAGRGNAVVALRIAGARTIEAAIAAPAGAAVQRARAVPALALARLIGAAGRVADDNWNTLAVVAALVIATGVVAFPAVLVGGLGVDARITA
jgi:hypothetical protein